MRVPLPVFLDVALDLAHLDGPEFGGAVEVRTCDDVELAVAVEVGHAARLGARVADAPRLELHAARATGDAHHGTTRLLALGSVLRLCRRRKHGSLLCVQALLPYCLERLRAHGRVCVREERHERVREPERVADREDVEQLREGRRVAGERRELGDDGRVRPHVVDGDEPAPRCRGAVCVAALNPRHEHIHVRRRAAAPEALERHESQRRTLRLRERVRHKVLHYGRLDVDDGLQQRELSPLGKRLEPEGAQRGKAFRRQQRDRLGHGSAPSVVLGGKAVPAQLLEPCAVRAQKPAERRQALVLRQGGHRVHASVRERGLATLPGPLQGLRLAKRVVGDLPRHLGSDDGKDGNAGQEG